MCLWVCWRPDSLWLQLLINISVCLSSCAQRALQNIPRRIRNRQAEPSFISAQSATNWVEADI